MPPATILLVFAFVLFVVAIFPPVTPKLELIAAGLACGVASLLFG